MNEHDSPARPVRSGIAPPIETEAPPDAARAGPAPADELDGLETLRGLGLTKPLAERARRAAHGFAGRPRLVRATVLHRETAQVHDGDGERSARVLPALARELLARRTSLAVGDWALAEIDAHGDLWLVARVPPETQIVRRDGDGARHVVVSNVDVALVVMGLDDDFNLRRLERYLALAQASGVSPAVVLTKADVVGAAAAAARLHELEARLGSAAAVDGVSSCGPGRGPAVPRFAVDATDPATATTLAAVVGGAGRTLVALGSSGAGKSTLTNTLLGRAVQDTGAVRENDGRGMHTTTARSLHRLPGGACLIDTPGVRTLRADVDASGVAAGFADIEALAPGCRFRDCTHESEPGCAVRAGVDADRLRNYRKLLREAERDGDRSWLERRRMLAAWKSRGHEGSLRLRLKRGE